MRTLLAAFVILIGVSVAGADDYATRMLAATYKIFNKDSTATGFFVNAPASAKGEEKQVLFVTAAHVFSHMTGDSAIFVLRMPKPDGSYERRDFEVKVRERDKPLWHKHPQEDVAVLSVKLPDDANVKPIEFDSLADEAAVRGAGLHIGSEMLMLGFPMRFEANHAGFPIARHVSIASYPLLPIKPIKNFLADFATFAGDSGGPVFIADPSQKKEHGDDARPLVVGIVIAQHFSDEKFKMAYEEQTIHHPLNLSTILYAQFAREVIDELKK